MYMNLYFRQRTKGMKEIASFYSSISFWHLRWWKVFYKKIVSIRNVQVLKTIFIEGNVSKNTRIRSRAKSAGNPQCAGTDGLGRSGAASADDKSESSQM